MKKQRKMLGFTLVELMIVIVILGLLASLVAPQMFSRVDSAQVRTAETQMRMIETAINTFRLDVGYFPENLEELRESDRRGWDGPYFPREIPMDPWGNPYVYERTDEGNDRGFTLTSLGRDGQEGGEGIDADIELQ